MMRFCSHIGVGLRRGLLALSLVMALSPVCAPPAGTALAQERLPEYRIKMVFLYKFAKFVEWPAAAFTDSAAPVVIGILGEDPFGVAFDEAVKGRTAQGRPIRLRRFDTAKEAKEAACHILYVSDSEKKRLPEVMTLLAASPVMTVGDLPEFTAQGGVLRFMVRDEQIRMQVNLQASKDAGIKISSRLLKMVDIYRDGER